MSSTRRRVADKNVCPTKCGTTGKVLVTLPFALGCLTSAPVMGERQKLSIEDVRHVAKLSRLALSEEIGRAHV